MAGRILEAKLVITGEDKTGPMFSAIEKKIAGLNRQVQSVERQSRSVNRAAQQVSDVARSVARTSRAVARAPIPTGMGAAVRVAGATRMAAGGIGRSIAGVAAPIAGAFAAEEITRQVIEKGSERLHERVRMQLSGMGATEIADAEKAMGDLSRKFPSVDNTSLMHMLRNARSVVGSYEEAAHIMEPLAKLRIVAQAAHPGQDMEQDLDKLVKGLEIKGVAQDPEKFRSYLNGMAKAVNVFGDTLRPSDYYEMFKYGRQSTTSLSEQYMLSVAPTLAQRLGGAQAGTAQSAFYNAIVGGRMTKSARERLGDFGLVEKSGAIVGAALAAINPYEWVNKIPARPD
jgi:hypothetical protein